MAQEESPDLCVPGPWSEKPEKTKGAECRNGADARERVARWAGSSPPLQMDLTPDSASPVPIGNLQHRSRFSPSSHTLQPNSPVDPRTRKACGGHLGWFLAFWVRASEPAGERSFEDLFSGLHIPDSVSQSVFPQPIQVTASPRGSQQTSRGLRM